MVAYGLVMVMSELPDPGSFGAAFVEFMRVMSLAAQERESEVAVRLREHLGTDPKGLPTTGAEFPLAEHPNLQLALDAVLGDAELVGFTTQLRGFGSIGLAEILAGLGMAGPISFGPVRYVDVEVGDGRVVQCVESALLLAVHQEAPLALVLSRGGDQPMRPSSLRLEGVSPAPGAVSGLLRELRAAMRAHNVFRGRIISLHHIDLVAAERTMEFGSRGVLFELLNQMEGLAEDEDLLFVLTTNRPDLIEPALAARPGRVDLALEIPLPDADGRRRLLGLYGAGIEIDAGSVDQLVERSDGVSGAFIKELVRQAWLRAALEDREPPTAQDLRRVLDDLLEERSTLTRRLLGQGGDDTDGHPFPAMRHALHAAGLPIPTAAETP